MYTSPAGELTVGFFVDRSYWGGYVVGGEVFEAFHTACQEVLCEVLVDVSGYP